ncbi:hypothetical protein VV99796_03734 [Vibrio vulnificus]|uniref:hypothetical protein n=1 Tax=Vibrio TaxID=662 RepID=UPI000929D626|nr:MULTISPECIES: hypothetical protein [Vibrio]EHT4943590.1 hypothetical protein [Vibrio vulnificus]MDE1330496.1 hypothetical protein [Vibrio aestuarianus]OJI20684.1 hypothetical protein VV99796_03734 [Vibrio vulnificus]OJI45315.1 hypothetical protein VVS316_03427 [Vibrio vulnificus]
MALLKSTVIKKIRNILDSGNYCVEDFEVVFPSEGSILVDIKFIAFSSFSLRIYEDTVGGIRTLALLNKPNEEIKTVIKCSMSPGEYKTKQSSRHESIDDAISQIYAWNDHIRQELVAMRAESQESENDDVLSNFQSFLNEPVAEPEKFFTVQEADELKSKLERLQKRVEELEADNQIEQAESNSLTTAIESTKPDIDVYPKGVWYRTAGNKILRTLKRVAKNKESRDLVIDVVKKLMESGT